MPPFSAADHAFMAEALRLAEHGLFTTAPNPRVGCVIVNQGRLVGAGWHARAGEPHAEVHALREAGQHAAGATVYVTLEPCSHYGRTPPCAEALIAAGVTRVVAAMQDPDPRVAGSGLAMLASAGIETATGLMEAQARQINPGFVSRMTRGRPWVTLKAGASLDGRTALANGASKWITGAAARSDVQRQRARSCAVLTGIGTVLADDPQLNVRELETGRQPLRVVADSRLRMPAGARMLEGGRVLVATAEAGAAVREALQAAGAEVLQLPDACGRVDLSALLRALAQREINELMVEAGPQLNGALLGAGLVDELLIYLAPSLLGDTARGLFALPAFAALSQRINLDIVALDRVGADLRIRARPLPPI